MYENKKGVDEDSRKGSRTFLLGNDIQLRARDLHQIRFDGTELFVVDRGAERRNRIVQFFAVLPGHRAQKAIPRLRFWPFFSCDVQIIRLHIRFLAMNHT